MDDVALFQAFNVELPGGGFLWEVKSRNLKHNPEAKKRVVPQRGEPGSEERIAHYRKLAEEGLPLFE